MQQHSCLITHTQTHTHAHAHARTLARMQASTQYESLFVEKRREDKLISGLQMQSMTRISLLAGLRGSELVLLNESFWTHQFIRQEGLLLYERVCHSDKLQLQDHPLL